MQSVTCPSETFRNPDGATSVLKQLNEQRLNGIECDLRLSNGQVHRPVHRCLIRASSAVLDRALNVQSAEQPLDCYEVSSLSSEALDSFIEYVYTSEITLTSETALDLHTVSIELEIPHLTHITMVYLHGCITANSCIALLNHAVEHNCTALRDECLRFCVAHYEDIIDQPEFVQIAPTEYIHIVSSPNLTIREEHRLFDSIKRWLDEDPDERGQYANRLSKHVRYQLFDVPHLLELLYDAQNQPFHEHIRQALIEFGALVQPIAKLRWERKPTQDSDSAVSRLSTVSPEWAKEILDSDPQPNGRCATQSETTIISEDSADITRQNGSNNDVDAENSQELKPTPLEDSQNHSLLLAVFGGRSSEKKLLRDVVCYRISSKSALPGIDLQPLTFNSLRVLPNVRKGFGAAAVWNQAFLIGGQPACSLQTVDVYDIHDEEWLVGPPLLTGRAWHSVCRSDHSVFAVGGVDKNGTVLSDGEMLDVRTGSWQLLPQMNQPRMSLAACVHNDVVYAVGGVKQATMEALDLRAWKWQPVATLGDPREAPGISVFGEKIYIFGGANQTGSLDSTIEFDLTSGCMKTMCPMPLGLTFSAVATVENVAFVVGGRNATETSGAIQLYDACTNQWWVMPQSLANARSSCCALVVAKV